MKTTAREWQEAKKAGLKLQGQDSEGRPIFVLKKELEEITVEKT